MPSVDNSYLAEADKTSGILIGTLPAVRQAYKSGESERTQSDIYYTNIVLKLIQHVFNQDQVAQLRDVLADYAQRHFKNPMQRLKIFGKADEILTQGDEILKRACWLYQNHPELYPQFALNPKAIMHDKIRQWLPFKKKVPHYSFIYLACARNPMISHTFYNEKKYNLFFTDPIFKEYEASPKRDLPYFQWVNSNGKTLRYEKQRKCRNKALKDLILEAHTFQEMAEKSQKKGR